MKQGHEKWGVPVDGAKNLFRQSYKLHIVQTCNYISEQGKAFEYACAGWTATGYQHCGNARKTKAPSP